MQGQAQDLGGNWLAAGDLNFSERYLAAVKRITPADLQRVARTNISREENRTLFALLPKGATPKTCARQKKARRQRRPEVRSANGLRLLVKEDHRLPFVEVPRGVSKAACWPKTPANNGITHTDGRLIIKGTKTRSAEQIAT
jgi:zinc protease